MIATKIYIGLNDADTLKQEHDTEKYISVLRNVCRSYKVAFSFTVAEGGYFHDDGRYTQETTLVITLIDADKELANEIAKDLCSFFHQESVMITEVEVKGYFVSDNLK
ncbi:MAG: hypothetical protein J6Q41_07465 [Firmicutes bacterium]|nr:hypothetical protein [Bacillota bacterium]